MVVLGLKDFANLPVDPVDPDTLALRGCYILYHLEDCLWRNLGGSLSLES